VHTFECTPSSGGPRLPLLSCAPNFCCGEFARVNKQKLAQGTAEQPNRSAQSFSRQEMKDPQLYNELSEWRLVFAALPTEMQPPTPIAVREEFQDLAGFRVHVDRWEVRGSRVRAAKLVVFHGGGGTGRLVGSLVWSFAEKGIECICPDLPDMDSLVRSSKNPRTRFCTMTGGMLRENWLKSKLMEMSQSLFFFMDFQWAECSPTTQLQPQAR